MKSLKSYLIFANFCERGCVNDLLINSAVFKSKQISRKISEIKTLQKIVRTHKDGRKSGNLKLFPNESQIQS